MTATIVRFFRSFPSERSENTTLWPRSRAWRHEGAPANEDEPNTRIRYRWRTYRETREHSYALSVADQRSSAEAIEIKARLDARSCVQAFIRKRVLEFREPLRNQLQDAIHRWSNFWVHRLGSCGATSRQTATIPDVYKTPNVARS